MRSLHKGQEDFVQLIPKKTNKKKKSNMLFLGYKRFPSREEDSSSTGKSENREENPFYKISTKDNRHIHDEVLTEEDKQLDEIILKMADLNGDESKMAKSLKRQPDWVL